MTPGSPGDAVPWIEAAPEQSGSAGFARWAIATLVAAGLHGAIAAVFLAEDPPEMATQAPEAAIMIDLPPELALPPAETVESVASQPAAEAPPTESEAMGEPTDAVETALAEQAVPSEDIAEAQATAEAVDAEAETAETAEEMPEPSEVSETTAALEAPAEAAEEVSEAAPEEVAEADVADAIEATPTEAEVTEVEIAEPAEVALPEEVTVSELAPPVEAARIVPTPRPQRRAVTAEKANAPPVKRQTTAKATTRPQQPPRRAAPPPASEASVAGQKASGAGRPDKNALSRFISSVRADIMRQRRSLTTSGRGKVAVVSFTIMGSGTLSGIRVSKSSGDPALDAAAVAMVSRASPVPAIPAAVGRSSVPASLPVRID